MSGVAGWLRGREGALWAMLLLTAGAVVVWGGQIAPPPDKLAAAPAKPGSAVAQRLAVPPGATSAHKPRLAEQLDALAASHKPANDLAAYFLITHCMEFERDGEVITFDLEEVRQKRNLVPLRGMNAAETAKTVYECAGMTERVRLSRHEFLKRAYDGGERLAILSIAREGPFGDPSALQTRPDDPLVVQWKAWVRSEIVAQAEDGSFPAIGWLGMVTMMGNALFERDPRLAYRYGVADGMLTELVKGSDAEILDNVAAGGAILQNLSLDLSREERAAELVEARRLFDLVRKRRDAALRAAK